MDLTTKYMGISLQHPFMVGASPMADRLDQVRKLEDAGASAIVMRSLFEEQLTTESMSTQRAMETHANSFAEALSYFPDPNEFVLGPDEYLEQLRTLKESVGIPVIGSLNGRTRSGWLEHARYMEQSGADGLELNLYDVLTSPEDSSESVEKRYAEIVAEVKKSIQIPVAVKLSNVYTSIPHVARRLIQAGADGLVLFNRFFQPNIDIENLEYGSYLELSTSAELPMRLRWLAILSARVPLSYAVTGGVHTVEDAVKTIMCGANAIQLVSSIYQNGPLHLRKLQDELSDWLEKHEYQSLEQMLGSMNIERCPNPRLLYRANYIHMLQTWQPE